MTRQNRPAQSPIIYLTYRRHRCQTTIQRGAVWILKKHRRLVEATGLKPPISSEKRTHIFVLCKFYKLLELYNINFFELRY